MKIEIIARGIFGIDGEYPVGTVLDVQIEPVVLAGRYRVVSGETREKVAITNPARDAEPDRDLRAQYEELFGRSPDGRWSAARLQSEIDKKLAE